LDVLAIADAAALEVGRAAIDLYSGRLALSEEELRLAQERDRAPAAVAVAPVRILLVGQVNAGKSSLVNALAQETRCAIGPLPTTARVAEYQLELEGRPAVSLVDVPGLDGGVAQELRAQAERADLVLWVAATQPARSADRQALDDLRSWARAQLARRPPRSNGSRLMTSPHRPDRRHAISWPRSIPSRAPLSCPPARSCRSPCLLIANPITSTLSGHVLRSSWTMPGLCSSIACGSVDNA
jgi:uncharacterized protein